MKLFHRVLRQNQTSGSEDRMDWSARGRSGGEGRAIFRYEFGKLLRQPMLYLIFAGSLALNLLLLLDGAAQMGGAREIRAMYEAVTELGTDLDAPETEARIAEWERERGEAESGLAGSAGAAAGGDGAGAGESLRDASRAAYLDYLSSARGLYDSMDALELLEQKMAFENYRPSPAYRRFLERCYGRIQARVEEIRATGEDQTGFYPGISYPVFHLLAGSLGRALGLEMALLLALGVTLLLDYERVSGTELLAYSAREGRRIVWTKFLAGMAFGSGSSAVLSVLSVLAFLGEVPMRGLWNTPVSSAILAYPKGLYYYPNLTFAPITVGGFLIRQLALLWLFALLAGAFCAAVWMCFHHGYGTLLAVSLGAFALLLASPVTKTFADTLLVSNPVLCWYVSEVWFMEKDIRVSFAGWEEMVLAAHHALAGVFCLLGWRRVRRRDF